MDSQTVALPPDLLKAAQVLAETLLRAEPIAAYQKARARLDADSEARALLERFLVAQAELRIRQARGMVTQVDVHKLRTLQREVQASSTLIAYVEAQQAAMAFLPEVNREISQLLGVDFASLAGPASC